MIAINGQKIKFRMFPNGETNVDGTDIIDCLRHSDVNIVDFKYHNDGDLLRLMFIKKYVSSHRSQLRIWYMPYSRMDRREYPTTVFTLKYACEFINDLNFDSVTVVEPHSDVTCALLNNATAVYPTVTLIRQVMHQIGFDVEKDHVFFPDAGAQKRYSKYLGFQSLVAMKERNFQSGKITRLEVIGAALNDAPKVLIIDDLCSYGGTFLMSAEKLSEIGAGDIYLLVTHCEESIFKGQIPSSPLIRGVFTTNTIIEESQHEKIHVFDIREVL